MDARELLELKLQRSSRKEREDTQRILSTMRKVDRREILEPDERRVAGQLMNRGLLRVRGEQGTDTASRLVSLAELQRNPKVQLELTSASDRFRRFF